jgi:tricorn protease
MTAGYYRFPAICQDTIIFVSEDDLWTVARQGGIARRLTSNLGEVNYPAISPNGEWLAFVGREEGRPEVYLMPAGGGSARRLTYLNSQCQVLGWTVDGRSAVFASTHHQVHAGVYGIFSITIDGTNGAVRQLGVGMARAIAFGPDGMVVIGRGLGDPARWKRYRGGTAGQLWIDQQGDGQFVRLLAELRGNIASPMWLGERLYFASDHEGIGNLYSCTAAGDDLRRHTDHEDFYIRNPSSDGQRIVYHAGADLFVYDPASGRSEPVAVDWRSPRVQRNRKFVSASSYLEQVRLRPQGDALALTTRGRSYAFYNHEGPVLQLGKRDGVRYRLPDWMNDGLHVVVVDDAAGEEELAIYSMTPEDEPRRLPGLDIGRPTALRVSPCEDKVAIANHRNELLVVDLANATLTVLDRSEWRPIAGFDWSPDGCWLAYGFGTTLNSTELRIVRVGEASGAQPISSEPPIGQPVTVTRPVLHDLAPSFDPDGKYLYFLSYREFNPVYDTLQFDLAFPWGMRPYLVTLRADLPNPFVPQPGEGDDHDEDEPGDGDEDDPEDDSLAAGEDEGDEDGEEEGDGAEEGEVEDDDADDADGADSGEDDGDGVDDDDGDLHGQDINGLAGNRAYRFPWRDLYSRRRSVRHVRDTGAANPLAASTKQANPAIDGGKSGQKNDQKRKPLLIEIEGIERRVLAFPVPDGRYGQIAGAPGRALYTSFPLRGALDDESELDDEHESQIGTLRAWVFKDYKSESVADNVNSFELSRNRKKIVYSSSRRLRVIAAGEKAPGDSGPGRKSGWIDLGRVKVSVHPQSEWEQMYREAWRLQRDHFWAEDMAEVDWRAVYDRYLPLIERVSTRSEFSDLVWEMQGELGSSHAYELGGDYRLSPHYSQGVLAADFDWDAEAEGYRISNIVVGDSWEEEGSSPLARPGVDVSEGDVLLAINGQRLDADTSPAQLLVNQAGNELLLTLAPRPRQNDPGSGEPDKASANKEDTQLRHQIVRAIHNDGDARYRAWVEANRRRVHDMTGGRIGYLHIPDMGPQGYAEFHRGFLAEVMRDGLIVDVRFNGGGNVSQLLLEKLARRRIGYDKSRWGGISPYPNESVGGPVVALTNEYAGSDGDIFCHSFKLLKLGPLIGKRTWGGVIGISPRNPLVDGTITTQPEFSFWFEDVGWTVENYGTEPDIVVEMTPQDLATGRDPQLDRAVAEALRLLADRPQMRPDLTNRPSRALPKLPRRAAEDSSAQAGTTA